MAVVTLRNIIHSAVAMMICFGSLAGMYALLGAPMARALGLRRDAARDIAFGALSETK